MERACEGAACGRETVGVLREGALVQEGHENLILCDSPEVVCFMSDRPCWVCRRLRTPLIHIEPISLHWKFKR
jgi:hypothetical protein